MKVFFRFWTAFLLVLCFISSAHSTTVDVMIVYDTTAKTWVDSNGGMNTFAAEVIAKLNQATTNSNVSLTFRLAHVAALSYTYSGDLGTDLDRIQRTSDGYMDNVHTLRNTYGTDLVAMLVDTGSPWGTVGMGYELTSSSGQPSYAFTVSAIQSVDISETLTHETGHNFGCGHSIYQKDSRGPGLFIYSAGWYFEGTGSTDYSTIMAYTNDGYGNIYIEVPYFSNPDVSYEGGVTGHATNGDNARTIENTMDVVASYRTAPVTTLTTPDTDPDQFSFLDRTNVPINTEIISNTIMVSGINTKTDISVTGGKYSINSGPYTDSDSEVNNGDRVTVQLISSDSYLAEVSATLVIGGRSDIFNVTTRSATTPDLFIFIDQVNVPFNTVLTSNVITVSGLGAEADIGVIGGEYKINSGLYTSGTAKVNNGNTVTMRQTSANSYSTTTNATLTIGGVSDTFSLTTVAAPDNVPAQFTFIDQANVPTNTVITSNIIVVSGINTTTNISITGGTYSINGNAYTGTSGIVNVGDNVTVQQISSAVLSTTTHATLTIGGVSDTFSITTKDKPPSKGDDGGGGGCFIATAAFGSPMAGQVEILRQFRDTYLLTNAAGKSFVAWYYRNGPVAAHWIEDKPVAKAAVRMALYPLIGFSFILISGYLPIVIGLLFLPALFCVRGRAKSPE
ncbi:MAG: CFI-box-CTERM domain-containing protein [Smithella sp.]